MNTGMSSSGPMIVDSIRKLGFKPEDIKLMINGHSHIDHAGAFAFFKQQFDAPIGGTSEVRCEGRRHARNDQKVPFLSVGNVTHPLSIGRQSRQSRPVNLGPTLRAIDVSVG